MSNVKSINNSRGDLKLKFIRKWHEKCCNSFTFYIWQSIISIITVVKSRVIRSQETQQTEEITKISAPCWPGSYRSHSAGGAHLVDGGLPQASPGVRVGSEDFLGPGGCGFHIAGDVIVLQTC